MQGELWLKVFFIDAGRTLAKRIFFMDFLLMQGELWLKGFFLLMQGELWLKGFFI